jgi:positive regulator of sigma E activity
LAKGIIELEGGIMSKGDTDKTVESESCLKVSDWVTILTSEKQGTISNVVSFGSLLVALVAILLSTGGSTTMQHIGSAIIALVFVAFVVLQVLRPFEERGKLAERILKKVMSGDLADESSIRHEWKREQEVLRHAGR